MTSPSHRPTEKESAGTRLLEGTARLNDLVDDALQQRPGRTPPPSWTPGRRGRHALHLILALLAAVTAFFGAYIAMQVFLQPGLPQLLLAIVLSVAVAYGALALLSDQTLTGVFLWRPSRSWVRRSGALERPRRTPGYWPTSGELFQLPPDISDFTNRSAELRQILTPLTRGGEPGTAVPIVAITGKAGVGKTALAVHAAHLLRNQFPDGQLYVDLRGTDSEPLDPAYVLGGILLTIGVARSSIPETLEQRSQLFRARLSERRALVVLDSANDEAQVRPLLPSNPSCGVLITSRSRLAALEVASSVDLQVLEPHQAVELLSRVVGAKRVEDEWEAALAIVGLCGHLPLAVRIAGAKLATRKHWRVAQLVDRLLDERRRLGELQLGDREVRASFALSCQGRSDQELRAFRLLGVLSAPDFAAWVAAAVLDCDLSTAEELLERLVDGQLLEIAGEDTLGQSRYRFHDLLRLFAREHLWEKESEAQRRLALKRAIEAYVALAERADELLEPGGLHHDMGDSVKYWLTEDFLISSALERNPLSWFTVERASLIAAVEQAYETEFWSLTWKLAGTLQRFFAVRAHWRDWEHVQELALDAARRVGDRQAEAIVLYGFGVLYRDQGRSDEAIGYIDRCLDIFTEVDGTLGEAYSLRALGVAYRDLRRPHEAMRCLDASMVKFRSLDDRYGEALVLLSLGVLFRNEGRLDDAVRCLEYCRAVFDEFGDTHLAAHALGDLGDVYSDLGRLEDAEACFDLCLPMFRELDERIWEANTLSRLGDLRASKKDFRGARQFWRDALSIFEGLAIPKVAQLRAQLGELDQSQT